MKLAILQWDTTTGNFEKNCSLALSRIRQIKDVDLILLPELWSIDFMNLDLYLSYAQPANGPLVNSFKALAKELTTDIFMGSFLEKEGVNYYNTSVYIDKMGNIKSMYRKNHLFSYRGKEAEILKSGSGIAIADYQNVKFGFATCYDLRFPELFRSYITKDVGVFIVAAAWPLKRLQHFRLFCQSRAIENLAFLIAANCCGGENEKQIAGHSMIVDPFGEIIAEAGEKEEILKAEIDLEKINYWRNNFSSLKDRRSTHFWEQQ